LTAKPYSLPSVAADPRTEGDLEQRFPLDRPESMKAKDPATGPARDRMTPRDRSTNRLLMNSDQLELTDRSLEQQAIEQSNDASQRGSPH